ncbi:MAG: dual specificity protein phosphatase family protein [Gammaproteobacteria bacterium]|nr:dual specificity protein phosphatase family protein [Gammaproteobacteria bacterium]
MKKVALVCLGIFIFNCCFAAINKTILIFDGHPHRYLPENFRTSNHPLPPNSGVPTSGLRSLHIIGCGEFSSLQLRHIKKRYPHLIVVDLRQESHGFVNGLPISWFAHYDWGNIGKPPNMIRVIERNLLQQLKAKKHVIIYKVYHPKLQGKIVHKEAIKINITSVYSEKQLTAKMNVRYRRFFVTDHFPPTIQQAKAFIRFSKSIPKNTWVLFHCKAGIGRTTTFMIMYDMLHNVRHITFNETLLRQKLLGGHDMYQLPNDRVQAQLSKDRITFLHYFYNKLQETKQ